MWNVLSGQQEFFSFHVVRNAYSTLNIPSLSLHSVIHLSMRFCFSFLYATTYSFHGNNIFYESSVVGTWRGRALETKVVGKDRESGRVVEAFPFPMRFEMTFLSVTPRTFFFNQLFGWWVRSSIKTRRCMCTRRWPVQKTTELYTKKANLHLKRLPFAILGRRCWKKDNASSLQRKQKWWRHVRHRRTSMLYNPF